MIETTSLHAGAGAFRLKDVSFRISNGAWGILLGPAGSGKTTLIETIAGLRRVASGSVSLRGENVTAVPPEERGVGMVYQHGYLFPHLSVERNIKYGDPKSGAASDIAERLGVLSLFDRSVTSLSGGERQLVALARALAPNPDILLLDEPFASLDPRRRGQARTALRELHRERGFTVLQVTHDFVEAGILADMIVVLQQGRVAQTGDPESVFKAPASAEVADFIGADNVIAGTITQVECGHGLAVRRLHFTGGGIELVSVGNHVGGPGHAVVRGEDITLARREKPCEQRSVSSACNVLTGQVSAVQHEGVAARVSIDVGTTTLSAIVTEEAARESRLVCGETVTARINATAVHLC